MSRQDFPILPAGRFATLFPLAIGGLLLLGGVVVAAMAAAEPRVLLAAFAPLLVVIPLTVALAWALRNPRVSLQDGMLQAGRFPRVRVAARDFDLEAARVLDLDRERELTPLFRLIGTRMPGYRSGWFWLRNRARAFLVVTDPHRVLLLPRRNGSALMLSLERPDTLLAALHRARG